MQSETSAAQKRTLTSSELEQGRVFLTQSHNCVSGAVKGLSDAQWKFKPEPAWSIAEIVDHIIMVQDRILGPVREMIAAAPAAPPDRDYAHGDAIAINYIPNRLAKFQAPEPIRPSGHFSRPEALDLLNKNLARLLEYLESGADLRRGVIPSPPLKAISNGAVEVMDGYQSILVVAGHTERHTKQILEVKADPNFPES